jgi:hypothetical protein
MITTFTDSSAGPVVGEAGNCDGWVVAMASPAGASFGAAG